MISEYRSSDMSVNMLIDLNYTSFKYITFFFTRDYLMKNKNMNVVKYYFNIFKCNLFIFIYIG